MDFTLTDAQIAVRDLTRDFVKREVEPVAAERDRIPDPNTIRNSAIVRRLPSRRRGRSYAMPVMTRRTVISAGSGSDTYGDPVQHDRHWGPRA